MYGWDSYFIIVGLLRDGRLDLAKDMVNNFLFEVEHYGAVLNAIGPTTLRALSPFS